MSYLDKLPLELLFLITPNLDPFELFSLLSVCPHRGSYHDLRQGLYKSSHDSIVALIYGICAGRLDLIEQVPGLPWLLKNFDDYARYIEQSDEYGLLGNDEKEAESFAKINFGGYINPLILAINQRSNYSREGLEIVQFLLDNGAEPNVPGNFRRRFPIYIATEKQDLDTVSLLLERQASPNTFTFQHELLPLDVAVERNHIGLSSCFLITTVVSSPVLSISQIYGVVKDHYDL
ncbi:hypothetical protein VN97_g11239 [Penicillium thymicola]|uniref:F-box domain-containing protein n=1 Tax=Penicillium thymicola TaxID=293382 RepID=A0AAI9T8D9_PENTH|nr:hypothetical protein VN97_g11239 [Penicillium thymicola]